MSESFSTNAVKKQNISENLCSDQSDVNEKGEKDTSDKSAGQNDKLAYDRQGDFAKSPHMFVQGVEGTRIHYNTSESPNYDDDKYDNETIIYARPQVHVGAPTKRSFWFRATQTIGILGSLGWASLCVMYFILEGGITTQTPYEMGVFIAGMTAPIAFFWMLLSYLQRNNDVRFYAESLRSEMHSLFFPSEEETLHVNKDIERMTEQAAQLAASSKVVLNNIHRARQGMRNEIKEFANFAKKTETYISGLSTQLNEKCKSFPSLIDEIDDKIELLNVRSDQAIQKWTLASDAMMGKAVDIETMMDGSANRILSISEVAQEKTRAAAEIFDGTIASLGITVDAVTEQLGSINDQFSAHTRTMQISSEELAKETNRLGSMIEDQIDGLSDAAGRSVETITQSLVAVSDQKDMLEESAAILTTKANDIATVINGSVVNLTETSEKIVSRAEETEMRLSEKATLISNTIDGVEDQIDRIESVSELASHRLSEGIDTAVNGANQVSDAVRRAVEMLTHTSKETSLEATDLIEQTISHIRQLKEVGQGNVSSTEMMVELLEKSRQQIDLASATAAGHVEMLTGSVSTQSDKLNHSASSLAEQVRLVSRALDEPLRMVGVAIADADSRHEKIQETLSRRVSELRQASEKATESAEVIRHSLREQASDLSELSSHIVTHAKSLNTELANNKNNLTATIDNTISDMSRLISGFVDHADTISHHGKTMVVNIEESTNALTLASSKLQDTGQLTESMLDQTVSNFIKQADVFDDRIIRSTDAIDQAHSKLSYNAEKILPLYDRVQSGSAMALDSLSAYKDNYSEIIDSTLSKIEFATNQYNVRLNTLDKSTYEVSTTLKTASEGLRETVSDLQYASETAHDKLQKLTNALDSQSSDIHILTDQSSLKIESLRNLINDQFILLGSSVDQAITKIGDAGLQFDTRAERISKDADIICDKFITAGNEAYDKAYALKQAAYNIAETSDTSVAKLLSNMEVMDEKTEKALFNLHKTSDSLAIKSNEVDVTMQSVLKQAKSYATDMKDQVRAVAEQSDISATQIGKSISTLLSTMDNVNGKTNTVVNDIQVANQSLYEQSGRFVTAVSKSSLAAEHATEIFSQQTDNLMKASRQAVDRISDIRAAELKAGREMFLSSARFVLESLHSLSIDFVRMTDGEIHDKDWKAYQNGDVSIFTAKMVDKIDKIPADKLRNKYAEDSEFRNYVQKFMRQFQDLLDQTNDVDKGAMLNSIFAGSDIGRVYRYLKNITGKD